MECTPTVARCRRRCAGDCARGIAGVYSATHLLASRKQVGEGGGDCAI